ncbi:MAG: hypothetical protein WDN04_13555 [Rhodospirillales bacterium]
MPSKSARVQESLRLNGVVVREFENVTLLSATDVADRARVYLGAVPSVPLVAGRDVVMTLPRNWKQHTKVTIDYDEPVPAPVRTGDVVGKLVVTQLGCRHSRCRCWPRGTCRAWAYSAARRRVLAHYASGA